MSDKEYVCPSCNVPDSAGLNQCARQDCGHKDHPSKNTRAPQAASSELFKGVDEYRKGYLAGLEATSTDSVTISREYPSEELQKEWYAEFQKKGLPDSPNFSLQDYADYAIKKAVDWKIQQALEAK